MIVVGQWKEMPELLLTGARASPDYFIYAKATFVAGVSSKLSLAKLSFAFTFFERMSRGLILRRRASRGRQFLNRAKLIPLANVES
jgi:hypothetical protein